MPPHRRSPALLMVPLVAAALAGCVAPGEPLAPAGLDRLSQPVFDLARDLVAEPLEAFAPDGVRLDSFVYRPATGQGVPAILILSPYFSNEAGRWGVHNQHEQDPPGSTAQIVRYFVPRGYAVVASSVRGTGYSGGCFTIGGPTEGPDHAAVVDAIVAQPWSSGAVAAYGGSYVGTTANDLLLEAHPAVRTIVPYAAISDWYRYSFVHGVPINPQGLTFNWYYERDVAIIPPYAEPDIRTAELAAENARCDHSEVQRGGFESALTGDKGPYWQARDFNTHLAAAPGPLAPVFLIHGLQDWNVKTDHLLPWVDLLRERGTVVKMWLGQWAHNRPNANSFREEWTRGDQNLTLLRWFDHHLKGIDTGILAEPLVDVQDDQGTWRHESEWPPARAGETRFFLAPGALQAGPGEGLAEWQDLGLELPTPPAPGGEQHYATFASEPLPADLRIAGQATLRLRLAHGAPSGTVAATLWTLAPNQTAHRINFGYYDLEHRGSLEAAEPVRPGEAFLLEVPLFPQDDVVPAGHRLLLTLAGNDSPRCLYTTLDPPQLPRALAGLGLPTGAVGAATWVCAPRAVTYDDPFPAMQPTPSGGFTTVFHGEDSVLVLPTVSTIAPFTPVTEQQRVAAEGLP